MIQQSFSKGLYSRLGKKEQLRATSIQDSKTKRPRVEIRNKVFEFVLSLFSDNMVALHGFIEMTMQASEKDIRCKLGVAIPLKIY